MARERDAADGVRGGLAALVAAAAQVLAPNALQFNALEFQRSPKEAQDAAREAAKLVKPGDLIFITTSGFLYSIGRRVTHSDYDHVAAVLDDSTVLHVGMPSATLMPLERLLLPQRQPVVLRAPMTDEELQVFLRCARQLVGTSYDIVRASQLVLRLALKHITGTSPLRKLPISMNPSAWICSDAIMVLLAGCSAAFREVLAQARKETQLDIFTIGSASLSDFSRIRQAQPDALTRIPLPVMEYTLTPPAKTWRQYVPEFVHFVRKLQSGHMKQHWPMLQEKLFPEAHALVARMPPVSWSVKTKIQVLGYAMVLLIVLRRGMTVRKVLLRALQLWTARYLVQQVLLHLDNRQLGASRL